MSAQKQVVRTDKAPVPKVPISQAIKANGMIYCSGFVPSDPATGALVAGDIELQTTRVLENLKAVLEAAGSSLDKTVKTTVFLADRKDFAGMNAVYGRYFASDPPARSTVEARLMIDAKVEIELIALA
jgi:2-iminobutanoate/2-iminopropanoate deaminase